MGIWLLFSNEIFYSLRILKPIKVFRKQSHERSNLYKHIKKLLLIVRGKDDDKTISTFYSISILLYLVTLVVVAQNSTIGNAILIPILIGLTPYLWLRLQLKKIRIDGSYEADIVINEFINQYKLNLYNIYDAIDETILRIKDAPRMKRQLFIMSLKLKEYRTQEELEAIIQNFVYSVGTEWIILLANNIYISITDNVNITTGLEDIQREIKQAILDKEREKRINLESISIAIYLTPSLYLLSIVGAKAIFSISFGEFMRYQLGTRTGFNYFIIIVVLSLINNALIILLKRQKFDI